MGYIEMKALLMSKAGEEYNRRIYSKGTIEKAFSEWMKSPSGGCITLRPDNKAAVEEKLTIDPIEVVGKVTDADFDKGQVSVLLDDTMLSKSDINEIRLGAHPIGLRYVGKVPTDKPPYSVESMRIISFVV